MESDKIYPKDGVYPHKSWSFTAPEDISLKKEQLEELSSLVGGEGCVVRHGYMVHTWGEQNRSCDVASAFKPVLSLLLMFAIQEGLLSSPDRKVSDFEPGLLNINNGKDGNITWKHLASQTSGYGLTEAPGQAFSYNDYALALYYDTLTGKVFKTAGTEVLKQYLAGPLGFEDEFTFEAFGPKDRPGRLALTVRDFARIGLFCLREGFWKNRQLLNRQLFRRTLQNPVPADLPFSSKKEADMLPGQRTIGGNKWITAIGPGYYSYNWWINGMDKEGRKLWPEAPDDIYCASGHGGKRLLWVIPGADMVICWNNTIVDDHDICPYDREALKNRALRLILSSVGS